MRRLAQCCRAGRSTSYLFTPAFFTLLLFHPFTFLPFYFFTLKSPFYLFTLLLLNSLFTFLLFYFSTFKQGFFALQTRLVYDVKKPCL